MLKSDLAEASAEEVAEEWRRRSARPGLSRVMRASQPEELNLGVTERTRVTVAEHLAAAAQRLGRPLRSALEIGCGIGRLTPVIARQASRVTALDMTPEMLDRARDACAGVSNVDFVTGRVERLPMPAEAFDAAVCVWVLMHILDPDRLAAACRRIADSVRYLVLIEYERAGIPVSRWSRLRGLEDYLALMPGARVVERCGLDYGGDLSFAALIAFGQAK